ncbi:hypothetical protein HY643_00190, partial [Candidatus Woesearchaeota archaeon]|nr:hypothetical protein [Candidatus Woesearchaeota archaeon]
KMVDWNSLKNAAEGLVLVPLWAYLGYTSTKKEIETLKKWSESTENDQPSLEDLLLPKKDEMDIYDNLEGGYITVNLKKSSEKLRSRSGHLLNYAKVRQYCGIKDELADKVVQEMNTGWSKPFKYFLTNRGNIYALASGLATGIFGNGTTSEIPVWQASLLAAFSTKIGWKIGEYLAVWDCSKKIKDKEIKP